MYLYLRLLNSDNGFVTYEYGKNLDNMVGTVTVDINDKNNYNCDFYPDSGKTAIHSDTLTALGKVFGFITDYKEKQKMFPLKYTHAIG